MIFKATAQAGPQDLVTVGHPEAGGQPRETDCRCWRFVFCPWMLLLFSFIISLGDATDPLFARQTREASRPCIPMAFLCSAAALFQGASACLDAQPR